jgi:hypothetical protein
MNGMSTDALVVAIVAAIIAFLPLLTSQWVRNRAKLLRYDDVASQPSEHHPSWQSFATAMGAYLIGCLPVFIFFASPNRDGWEAAVLSVFILFFWTLATCRVWTLRHTRVSIEADVIIYETGRSKKSIPTNAVRSIFMSGGYIVVERTDTSKVAIPMIFARNAVLYAQLTGVLIKSTSRGS